VILKIWNGLGDCPRIAIFPKSRNARKNYQGHIVDIPRIIFSGMTCLRAAHRQAKSLGEKAFSDSLLVVNVFISLD